MIIQGIIPFGAFLFERRFNWFTNFILPKGECDTEHG